MSTQTMPPTVDQLSRQQLEIYAREFQEHFYEERRLREQLESRNRLLERHLQEVAAIEGMNQTIHRQHRDLSQMHAQGLAVGDHVDAATSAGTGAAGSSMGAVLQKVADLSRELVHAEYSVLMALENGWPSSTLTSGLDADGRKAIEALVRDRGIQSALRREVRPVRVKLAPPDRNGAQAAERGIKVTSLLGIPIVDKGQHIGNLYLANKEGAQEFSQEDASMMVMFATQAAVAIGNARIYLEIQSHAVWEERDRIGKDLHDGIIQSIYAVGLNLESCADTVMEEPLEVKSRIKVAVTGLNEVIGNIRSYIMDLRPDLLGEKTLSQRLQGLATEFSHNTGIPVEVQMALREEPRLASLQTAHVLALMREALTNIAKHAGACTAVLGLAPGDGAVRLWVQDDGVGFDPAEIRDGARQGLRNMKERAAAMGGDLAITSSPGRGTRLEITIPMSRP